MQSWIGHIAGQHFGHFSGKRPKTMVQDSELQDERVIYLDIDGVINRQSSNSTGYEPIDQTMVRRLALIARSQRAKVVLSSTWRLNHDKCSIVEKELQRFGVEM